jgi:NAD-dependent deacetylase
VNTRLIKNLSEMIGRCRHIVVLTGAGMDTESNIPDFRGREGWWNNIDPRTVAHVHTLESNYDLFHQFYAMRIGLLQGVQPHRGHYVLSLLERRGILSAVVTQNVSGLHRKAGSKSVCELHGNIRTIRCNQCGAPAPLEDFLAKHPCRDCQSGTLRPNVVLFGEALPEEAWNTALSQIQKCDLLIVIGTSLEVYPVNRLPLMAKGSRVFINNEERGDEYNFDLKVIGNARATLESLGKMLL